MLDHVIMDIEPKMLADVQEEIDCPYCGEQMDMGFQGRIMYDVPVGRSRLRCPSCGRVFEVERIEKPHYTSRPIGKDGKAVHDWKFYDLIPYDTDTKVEIE